MSRRDGGQVRQPAGERPVGSADALGLLYILMRVSECTNKLVCELMLNDPMPFVPLTKAKRGNRSTTRPRR